jgi:hypothetical protein
MSGDCVHKTALYYLPHGLANVDDPTDSASGNNNISLPRYSPRGRSPRLAAELSILTTHDGTSTGRPVINGRISPRDIPGLVAQVSPREVPLSDEDLGDGDGDEFDDDGDDEDCDTITDEPLRRLITASRSDSPAPTAPGTGGDVVH